MASIFQQLNHNLSTELNWTTLKQNQIIAPFSLKFKDPLIQREYEKYLHPQIIFDLKVLSIIFFVSIGFFLTYELTSKNFLLLNTVSFRHNYEHWIREVRH